MKTTWSLCHSTLLDFDGLALFAFPSKNTMNEKGDMLTTLVYEFILHPATGSKLGLQVEPTLLRYSSEVSGPNLSCEKYLFYSNQPYLEKNLKACSSFE
ncbi:hypothetical protein NC652_012669 [Populus alba x Populus x berolinensis]|nr:hypothetical protein NC652_012669 [Populus alba x Populus x berolinensis]